MADTLTNDWGDTETTAQRMGGYSPATLRQWRYLGLGPPYSKIGKHVRYHWPTVERWMLKQLVHPNEAAS